MRYFELADVLVSDEAVAEAKKDLPKDQTVVIAVLLSAD